MRAEGGAGRSGRPGGRDSRFSRTEGVREGPALEGVEAEPFAKEGMDQLGGGTGVRRRKDGLDVSLRERRIGEASLAEEAAEQVPGDDHRPGVGVLDGRMADEMTKSGMRVGSLRGLHRVDVAVRFAEELARFDSRRARIVEGSTRQSPAAVGKLAGFTDQLFGATREGTQSAERLYGLSRCPLGATLATFGVALSTLVVANLRIVR